MRTRTTAYNNSPRKRKRNSGPTKKSPLGTRMKKSRRPKQRIQKSGRGGRQRPRNDSHLAVEPTVSESSTDIQMADFIMMDSSSTTTRNNSTQSTNLQDASRSSPSNHRSRRTSIVRRNRSNNGRYYNLIKKSLSILKRKSSANVSRKSCTSTQKNISASESDCILIEDAPPEIIVIDDDDDDNDPLSKNAQIESQCIKDSPELNKDIAMVSEPYIPKECISPSRTTVKNIDNNEKATANDTKSSLESGEIDDSTLVAVDITPNEPDVLSNAVRNGDNNLTLFYEDITPNSTMLNDEIPMYSRGVEDKTLNDTSLPADDVVFVSSTPVSRKKRKRKKNCDDSVIFVGEIPVEPKDLPTSSTCLDFVPLDSDNGSNRSKQIASANEKNKTDGILERITQPFRKFKENLGLGYFLETTSTPVANKQTARGNDIPFTSSERKRNAIYNSNTYNPHKEKRTPGKRMVIVDGSNVAYAHSCNREFSVKGIEIALEYFEKMGHEAKAVVPQHRLQKSRSSDADLLERLHRDGKIVLTPCKNLPGKSTASYDDRFILQLAVEFDAAIVSNDNFRDLIAENPAFKKVIETRVIGYTWCKDMFMLPKDPYGRNGPSLSVILNRT